MRLEGYIDLPEHQGQGGFDHAAVHLARSRMYVTHTANNAVDVIDLDRDGYLESITNLTGVAGALVSEATDQVFTSNRGEDTAGILDLAKGTPLTKVGVCVRPNGLAFDAGRSILLAAGVGEPYILSFLDVTAQAMVASLASPGRTRWTVYDRQSDRFYVNVGDPYLILVIAAGNLGQIERTIEIPCKGPHGLDIDSAHQMLFCACDGGNVYSVKAASGEITAQASLSGVPDVMWFNGALNRIYVAVGDPGTIDVFDAGNLQRIETVATERGAHTTGFDAKRNRVYAFLPESHRAAVFQDQ